MRKQDLGPVIKKDISLIWKDCFSPRWKHSVTSYIISDWCFRKRKIEIGYYSFIYLFTQVSEHQLRTRNKTRWKIQPLPTRSLYSNGWAGRFARLVYAQSGMLYVLWWKKKTAQSGENKVISMFHGRSSSWNRVISKFCQDPPSWNKRTTTPLCKWTNPR